ncbi:MAG: sec-independent protein translocase protein TatA [Alteromonadaceae bacterium]|jgi:sec-independent protein translocase protein TatA
MGNISIWQLLIIAVIVVLLFGTKKLRNLGTDLGSAIKGFKNAVTDENAKKDDNEENIATKSSETLHDKATTENPVDVKKKDQA